MNGRTALILGGSGGIGLAVAVMLAEEGYSLTIQGRRDDRVAAACDHLSEKSKSYATLGLTADLADEAQIVNLVETHAARWGRLDVLINSAGLGVGQSLEGLTSKMIDLQFAVNFKAAALATRHCLPLLKRAGEEHRKALIAHISSWAGKYPPDWLSIYAASKAALSTFAISSQREVAGSGIQVTAICPATVETEMTAYVQEEIPAEDMLRPEDLAEAVRFLLQTSPSCVVPELLLGRVGDLAQ